MPRAADHPVLALVAAAVLLVSPLFASAASVHRPADRASPRELRGADLPIALLATTRDAHPTFDELRPVKPTDPMARWSISLAPSVVWRSHAAGYAALCHAIPLYTRLARLTI